MCLAGGAVPHAVTLWAGLSPVTFRESSAALAARLGSTPGLRPSPTQEGENTRKPDQPSPAPAPRLSQRKCKYCFQGPLWKMLLPAPPRKGHGADEASVEILCWCEGNRKDDGNRLGICQNRCSWSPPHAHRVRPWQEQGQELSFDQVSHVSHQGHLRNLEQWFSERGLQTTAPAGNF